MSKAEMIWQVLPYVVAVISAAVALVQSKWQMPKELRDLLAKPGVQETIQEGIRIAQNLQGKSDTEKRDYVVSYLKGKAVKLLDDYVPTWLANMAVEFVYARLKKQGVV